MWYTDKDPSHDPVKETVLLVILFQTAFVLEVTSFDIECEWRSASCVCPDSGKEVAFRTNICERNRSKICGNSITHLKAKCKEDELARSIRSPFQGDRCKYVDNITVGPPNVTTISNYFEKHINQYLEIICKVRSNPEAKVRWYFNGERITHNRRYDLTERKQCNPTLKIRSLQKDDTGNFTCLATNANGSASQTIHVHVRERYHPFIKNKQIGLARGQTVAYLGGSVKLLCTVKSSDGVPTVTWYRNSNRVSDDTRHENSEVMISTLMARNTLLIKNVTLEDHGNWTCLGHKNKRSVTATFYLTTVPCPAGYFCPWQGNTIRQCDYGTYSEGKRNTTYQCQKCPNGTPLKIPKIYKHPAKSLDQCPTGDSNPWPVWSKLLLGGVPAVLLVIIIGYKHKVGRKYTSSSTMHLTIDRDDECIVALTEEFQVLLPDHNHGNGSCGDGNHGNVSGPFGDDGRTEFPTLYDVFICYSSRDIKFAKEIQRKLEQRNFKCCIDLRDFMAGEAITANIANAIYHSKKTLALLSPDFITSDWCKDELQQALTRNIRQHQVIPILYKHCDVPEELKKRTYIDYTNCHVKQYFWDQLEKCLEC